MRIFNKSLLARLVAQGEFRGFGELFILAPVDGRVEYSTQPGNEGLYRVLDMFFKEGKTRTFIQNAYPSPVTRRPTITISTPLIGRRRELLDVLAADVDMKAVSGTRFGSEEFPGGIHSEGIDRSVGGGHGSGGCRNHDGTRVLGVYRWIPPLGLALAVSVFARRIARPILSIKEAAVRVAGGNLGSKAPVLTRDEVGVLAESFIRMTGEMKALYDALDREKEHFRALIESSADIILVLDREGTVKFASP